MTKAQARERFEHILAKLPDDALFYRVELDDYYLNQDRISFHEPYYDRDGEPDGSEKNSIWVDR